MVVTDRFHCTTLWCLVNKGVLWHCPEGNIIGITHDIIRNISLKTFEIICPSPHIPMWVDNVCGKDAFIQRTWNMTTYTYQSDEAIAYRVGVYIYIYIFKNWPCSRKWSAATLQRKMLIDLYIPKYIYIYINMYKPYKWYWKKVCTYVNRLRMITIFLVLPLADLITVFI